MSINLFDFWSIPIPDKCATCGARAYRVDATLRGGVARVAYDCEAQISISNNANDQPGSTTQNHPCRKPRADLAERMVAMIQTSGLPQSDQDDAIQAVRGSLGVWGGR